MVSRTCWYRGSYISSKDPENGSIRKTYQARSTHTPYCQYHSQKLSTSTLPPQTATEPPVAPGSPPSIASAPLLPSPGQNPCSQKRAKDRGKRQPAHGQSVSDKQTNGTPSFFAFVLVASGLRRAWGPRDPRQAPLAAGSHAIALGCAETTPRGPAPPALAGTGPALAEAYQGPRQATTSSRSAGARQGPRQAATSSRSAGQR